MESQFRTVIRQKIIDAQAAPLPLLTRRDIWLPAVKGKATAVIGMRRAGKTSLLWQILAGRIATGTPREGLLYFSFEDERLADMQVEDLDLLVESFYQLNPSWRDVRRATFFLDEIQLVPGWELFARRLLDSENIELFLSGSSARLLLRDVVERHNLSQPQVLHWMVRQLLGNAAGSFSINKFHADLKSRGVAVGKDTLHSYLAHLEDAFLLSSLDLATDSERRRQVNPRKVYPVDTGLMALFDRSGKANVGHALETAVLHELQRRGAQVNYVRTSAGFEVDFYARGLGGDEALIQVCADLGSPDTLAREVRALQDAATTWPNASLQLITFNQPKGILPPEIQLHIASDWLLRTA